MESGKPLEVEDLLKQVDELGMALREVIVLSKKIPRTTSFEPYQDPTRALALAQSNLQTGLMWLRRAISPPKEF